MLAAIYAIKGRRHVTRRHKKTPTGVVSVSFDSLKRKTTTVTANGGRNDGGDVLLGNSWPQVRSGPKQCQGKTRHAGEMYCHPKTNNPLRPNDRYRKEPV